MEVPVGEGSVAYDKMNYVEPARHNCILSARGGDGLRLFVHITPEVDDLDVNGFLVFINRKDDADISLPYAD